MQSLSQIGNARREERVLLPALIELRSEQGDEALMADGLDVSPSGLSVRAAFVPEVGTRLMLSFRCPPQDDAVHALGEVVWSGWDGPRTGSFGMRFLELDTKSATAIRRYVMPGEQSVEAPALPRAATMRIDGLGAPIEADVRLYDRACIVLEQELGFLRLGRGIEVDVPGRGVERGRIASIELRQGPLDTPTLVFGVLLDERRELAAAEPPASRSQGRTPARGDEPGPLDAQEQELDAGEQPAAPELTQAARVPLSTEPLGAARGPEKRRADEPRVVRVAAGERAAPKPGVDDDEEFERALQRRTPEGLVLLGKLLATSYAWLRQTLVPWLLAGGAKLRALFGASDEKQALPVRALMVLARVRAALAALITRMAKSVRKRRTTTPAPRMQRTQGAARVQRNEPATPPRNRRLLTIVLAAVGVGLGVYALAPRSGADRMRVPKRELSPARTESFASSMSEPRENALPAAPLVTPQTPAELPAEKLSTAPLSSAAETSEPLSASPRFGEANVPNGRVFILRMSGPVRGLEGEAREDGFTVRIPGRLALDRASPIATSHRAVARALILNRGEYAELTVEFLPGMRPKYQVTAKDSSIEVTLERL